VKRIPIVPIKLSDWKQRKELLRDFPKGTRLLVRKDIWLKMNDETDKGEWIVSKEEPELHNGGLQRGTVLLYDHDYFPPIIGQKGLNFIIESTGQQAEFVKEDIVRLRRQRALVIIEEMEHNHFEELKEEVERKIEGMIIYHYGERNWYRLSKKQRYQIIENIVRDTAPSSATEEEINKIIKIEQSEEG